MTGLKRDIIHNGVEVSDCNFYFCENVCRLALAFSVEYEGHRKCQENPNCHYKLWKRAELKPTYPFNEAFIKMLQDSNKKLDNCITKVEEAIQELRNG